MVHLFLAMALRQAFAHGHPTAGWMLGAIACIGLLGLLKPFIVRWLFIGATVAAFPIGWLVTQLMLAIMFYLVLTPVALVFRWRGRDELQLKRKTEQARFLGFTGQAARSRGILETILTFSVMRSRIVMVIWPRWFQSVVAPRCSWGQTARPCETVTEPAPTSLAQPGLFPNSDAPG